MAIGADDTGDDIEIGNENHGDTGTTFFLDPDDQGHFGPFVIRALAFSNTPGLPNTPVNGIEVEGAGGGSAVVATAIGVSATSGSAVVAQAESKISPAVLANNDPGAGVVGISTVALGTNIPGAGVIGISTKSVPQPFAFPQATGVAGFTNIANGLAVLGECDAPTGFGVLGRSSRGIGVGASSSKGPGASRQVNIRTRWRLCLGASRRGRNHDQGRYRPDAPCAGARANAPGERRHRRSVPASSHVPGWSSHSSQPVFVRE